jgi:hypothetical protein
VSNTTDYAPPDSTIFNAITGTDGDSAVFPYQPQRSSDLYESNGDTIDNEYLNYGMIGWTPEMDTCATGGDASNCRQFSYPDQEDKIGAVFQKNLFFVLNVAESITHIDRPTNWDNDPSVYQVKPTYDIQPNKFDVSYGNPQTVEAIVRKSLGQSDVRATVAGQNVVIPMTGRTRGRALRRGERRVLRAPPRDRAGPHRQPQRGARRRRADRRAGRWPAAAVLLPRRVGPAGSDEEARAGDRGRGLHRQVAERGSRLRHRAALPAAACRRARPAAGYEVATYDIDAPPLNAGTPVDEVPDVPRRHEPLRRRRLLLGRRLRALRSQPRPTRGA